MISQNINLSASAIFYITNEMNNKYLYLLMISKNSLNSYCSLNNQYVND